MSTHNEIIYIFSFCVNHVQLVQNEIIISLCADSRHTYFFISFCLNGIRSVSNDEHFVMAYLFNCFDFDELLYEFFYAIFKSILTLNLSVYYPSTNLEGYIFGVVPASLCPFCLSVHTFCPTETISQYLFVRFKSFFVQMISTMYFQYPISFVKIDPLALHLWPLFL